MRYRIESFRLDADNQFTVPRGWRLFSVLEWGASSCMVYVVLEEAAR